ncbi:phosphate ABC transporter permease [Microseira wollei]|uniref:Phosphate ABC transporter permease n=1 Tax=Microseira wollei NIES-4236 TaxID=2530354 RepID=A0AAV3XHU7_9CYAN|nr:phosphate ABC transporter permease [Microseira wollei]GET41480.1 hypothetical protein MiSe_62920 [Microseira wollei NIES-4236]
MLIPLTREKFEQLIPLIATGSQYKYSWGKPRDVVLRLLISAGIPLLLYLLHFALPDFEGLISVLGIIAGLYVLWEPILRSSLKNAECRRYKYSGFWRGEVLDAYVSDEVVGKQLTTNKRGELMVVEDRQKQLNLEVGDETGFSTGLQVPLRREYKGIRRGQIAEMMVMSNRPDLSRISKVSDIFIPDLDLWVSDYPYLRRDEFADISRELQPAPEREREPRRGKRFSQDAAPKRRPRTTQEDW